MRTIGSNLNHYHKESGLLFQFILSEYLRICGILQSKKNLELLVKQLAGSVLPSTRIFSASFDDSPLAKLRSYCAYIAYEEELPKNERDSLKKLSFDLWELGIECQEHLDQKELLKTFIKKIEKLTEQFGEVITHFVKHYADDENILFFLLRHQEQWNGVFGKKGLKQLLETHYNQLSKAEEYLTRAYRKRNFDHLIPVIENHFAALTI